MNKLVRYAIIMLIASVLGAILSVLTNENGISCACFIMLGMLLFNNLED